MRMKKGFTLIELLVVIAIIGVLSSIVLASLKTSRDKGYDTKTVQTLRNLQLQAIILNEDASYTYASLCGVSKIQELYQSVGGTCLQSGSAWVIYAPLRIPISGNLIWCTDFTGTTRSLPSPPCGVSCSVGGACMPS